MYLDVLVHGLTSCIIFRLIAVTDRAASGWERGIPYLLLYELGLRLCSRRCLDNCLKLAPHSRHITACLVMLFRQSTGSAVVWTEPVPSVSSCACRVIKLA
jgi:hypothetical protein